MLHYVKIHYFPSIYFYKFRQHLSICITFSIAIIYISNIQSECFLFTISHASMRISNPFALQIGLLQLLFCLNMYYFHLDSKLLNPVIRKIAYIFPIGHNLLLLMQQLHLIFILLLLSYEDDNNCIVYIGHFCFCLP